MVWWFNIDIINWFSAYDGLRNEYSRTIHAVPQKDLGATKIASCAPSGPKKIQSPTTTQFSSDAASSQHRRPFVSEGVCRHLDSALVDAWRHAIWTVPRSWAKPETSIMWFFPWSSISSMGFTRRKMPRKCHFYHETFTIHQPWLGSIFASSRTGVDSQSSTDWARPFSWALPCFTSSLTHYISFFQPQNPQSRTHWKDIERWWCICLSDCPPKHVSSCLMSPKTEAPRTRKALANAKRWFSSCTCTSSQEAESPGISRSWSEQLTPGRRNRTPMSNSTILMILYLQLKWKFMSSGHISEHLQQLLVEVVEFATVALFYLRHL